MSEPTNDEAHWTDMHRVRRAMVVVDVVESVRLMRAYEADVIARWRRFVHEVRSDLLPPRGGRMVKSLGDGMLLEFATVHDAVAASLAIQAHIDPYNAQRELDEHLRLRIGIHVGEVVMDHIDAFGPAVNLTARLAGLAGPGEIVASAEVRAELAVGLDADVEDLGDCWLKHIDEPVRAARLMAPGRQRMTMRTADAGEETIGVAVLPFVSRQATAGDDLLGDLLADDIIGRLSHLPQLRVISRLSTAAFRGRAASLEEIGAALGTAYVVHGTYVRGGGSVRLQVHLSERSTSAILWSGSEVAAENDVLLGDGAIVEPVVAQICSALVGAEVRRACSRPLPTLASYTILIGAVALLHSLSVRDFGRSREMLVYLSERHPGLATPRAWLGLWHVMRVGQGWSADPATDAAMARQLIAAALDLDPSHSLSLAIDGLVAAYVHKDLETAGQRYDAALKANPNEGLAWLYRSAWHAYREEGGDAVASALRAQSLSPLDPMKYYYDNFTSTAMLSAGDLAGTIDYGRRSLRANRMHGPTLRILAIAHSLAGDMPSAAAMVERILQLEPGFTVAAFRQRYPGQRPAQVERYAEALARAGLAAG